MVKHNSKSQWRQQKENRGSTILFNFFSSNLTIIFSASFLLVSSHRSHLQLLNSELTKPADFVEIHRNSAELVRTKFKTIIKLFKFGGFYCSPNSNFWKIRNNIIKLEQILSVLVKKFFQIGNVSFVKIQISSNIQNWPTWPMTFELIFYVVSVQLCARGHLSLSLRPWPSSSLMLKWWNRQRFGKNRPPSLINQPNSLKNRPPAMRDSEDYVIRDLVQYFGSFLVLYDSQSVESEGLNFFSICCYKWHGMVIRW
jgi:hypothetical protein